MIMCYLASAQVNTLTGKQSQRHINGGEQRDWSSEKGKLWFDYGSAPCKIWPRSWRQKLTPSLHKTLLGHELWQSTLRRVSTLTLSPHRGSMGWHNSRDACGHWQNLVKLTAARAGLHQRVYGTKGTSTMPWEMGNSSTAGTPVYFIWTTLRRKLWQLRGLARGKLLTNNEDSDTSHHALVLGFSLSLSVCLYPFLCVCLCLSVSFSLSLSVFLSLSLSLSLFKVKTLVWLQI